MEVETQKNPSHVYFSKLRKENQEELKRRFVEFAETYRKTSEQKQKEEAEKRQKEEKNDILKKEIEDLEGLLRSKKRELEVFETHLLLFLGERISKMGRNL
jgi:uncharacterized FlaG/YvyC family protein